MSKSKKDLRNVGIFILPTSIIPKKSVWEKANIEARGARYETKDSPVNECRPGGEPPGYKV